MEGAFVFFVCFSLNQRLESLKYKFSFNAALKKKRLAFQDGRPTIPLARFKIFVNLKE